ncbi:MAG: 50S ribosomal protein L4, partial [Alphaproteobacteria bacterium]|nr:50S ribosomal protein L4 [Alphaproteobacteria bacterium]
MQIEVLNLDGKTVGKQELADVIFGIEPRADILHRVVTWQRANARAGTHAVKTVSDVAGSGKKAFKQKKTGNAREGEKYNVHMRGGGVVHGPVVRDHSIDLPKKIRSLGLKMALSSKLKDGSLIVIDSEKMSVVKTNTLFNYYTVPTDSDKATITLELESDADNACELYYCASDKLTT